MFFIGIIGIMRGVIVGTIMEGSWANKSCTVRAQRVIRRIILDGRIDGRDGQTLTSIRRNAKKIIYVTWTRSPGINAFTGQLGFCDLPASWVH